MIVCAEGIDGSGKATLIKNLADHFRRHNVEVKTLAFPAYDTKVGQVILDILKNDLTFSRNRAEALQALMTINRMEFIEELRHFSRQENGYRDQLLLLDRYSVSGFAYGIIEGLNPEWIAKINSELPEPDVCLLIDTSVEESFRRRPERRDANESNAEFLEKVRAQYLKLFDGRDTKRWVILPGMKDPEFVLSDALKAIEQVSGGKIYRACLSK